MDFDDLPDSWAIATVEETGEYINGFAFKPSDWKDQGIPIIRIQNLTSTAKEFNYTDKIIDQKYLIKDKDILVSWSATLGAFMWKGQDAYLNQHIFKVIPNTNLINKNFLYHLLNIVIGEMINGEHLHGSTMKHINRKPFLSHPVLIPPLNEQKRIVEKIELIQERTKIVKRELENIKVLLKKLRRSLLASAFRGDLTKDWRANHPDIEPAEVLLERIKQERRSKWEQAELEKMRAKGITPKDDKWKSKYSEPQPVKNIDDLPSIPDGWCWGTVEQFADVGTGATPLKKKKEYYENGTIPWVTSGSLNDLFITNPDNYITPLALKETNTKIFPKHTLLVAMYGEGKTRGKVSELLIEATTNQACAAILIEGIATIIRPIVKLFFLKNYDDLRRLASGGVQPNLNLTMIKLTAVPLPPLEEQQEIVRKLEKMMKFADQVEERVKEAEEKLNKFNQSVLAKAFRGKLVPQDPNDEPASVLLGKIQQEKNKTTSKKTKK